MSKINASIKTRKYQARKKYNKQSKSIICNELAKLKPPSYMLNVCIPTPAYSAAAIRSVPKPKAVGDNSATANFATTCSWLSEFIKIYRGRVLMNKTTGAMIAACLELEKNVDNIKHIPTSDMQNRKKNMNNKRLSDLEKYAWLETKEVLIEIHRKITNAVKNQDS